MASKELAVDNWHGVGWMCVSSLAFSYRSLLAQKVNAVYNLTALQISYLVMPLAAMLLIPFAITLEASILKWHSEKGYTRSTILAIVSIPILGLINMTSLFEVVKQSSSLTM